MYFSFSIAYSACQPHTHHTRPVTIKPWLHRLSLLNMTPTACLPACLPTLTCSFFLSDCVAATRLEPSSSARSASDQMSVGFTSSLVGSTSM